MDGASHFQGIYRVTTLSSSTSCSVSAGLPLSGRRETCKAMMPLLRKVNILHCGMSSVSVSSVLGATRIDPAVSKSACLANALRS